MTTDPAPNATMEKFGYPETLVKIYDHWVVQLRPAQVTPGSLVVVCREPVTAFGDAGPAACGELAAVARDVEACLRDLWSWDRINWLMLMMVDPDVHFHVIPRYATARLLGDREMTDGGWPGPPDLAAAIGLDGPLRDRMVALLKDNWPG